MAKYRSYRCPDCGGTFKHMHVLSDDPPPDRCQLCGAWVAVGEPVFVPVAPGIRQSTFAKSWDQTARAMEAGSIERAEDAGDMLDRQLREAGVDDETRRKEVFELKSGLKITNMRDPSEMREGDISAILPTGSSEAAQRLSIGPSRPGFQQVQGGVPNHAPGVGPSQSGSATHTAINGHQGWQNGTLPVPNPVHQARAAQMTRAGEMGSYTEK